MTNRNKIAKRHKMTNPPPIPWMFTERHKMIKRHTIITETYIYKKHTISTKRHNITKEDAQRQINIQWPQLQIQTKWPTPPPPPPPGCVQKDTQWQRDTQLLQSDVYLQKNHKMIRKRLNVQIIQQKDK